MKLLISTVIWNLMPEHGPWRNVIASFDWQSKITQDYILDRSVVKDVEYDDRATVGNRFADSLVKSNPNRFEIVQNQDLIRGRDY